jgi:hypothetical protein
MRAAFARKAPEKGYAILFVLFLVALVLIGSSTIVLDSLTEGRREREAQMIWRGKQYERAIRMYYRQFGRFPASVDDLVKVQDGQFRFLREAYKNPMNTQDGSWRFIYVTPAGQLIGSVQYVSLQQMAFLDQQRRMGLTPNAPSSGSANGADGSDAADNSGSDTGAQAGGNPALTNIPLGGISSSGNLSLNNLNPSQLQALQSQLQGLSPQQVQALEAQFQGQIPPQLQSQLQQMQAQNSSQPGGSSFFTQPGANPSGGIGVQESSDSSQSTDEEGPVVGGFIIGVGGKENKASIKIYKGGTTYKHWEFIFNPLEQVAVMGAAGVSGSAPGTNIGTGMAPMPVQAPTTPSIPQGQPQTPQQPQ